MSSDSPSTQPSGVSTEDQPRPRDEHITTDDGPQEEVTPPATEEQAKAAASPDAGSNDQESAPGNEENQPRQRDRRAERKIKQLARKLTAAEKREQELQARLEAAENEVSTLRDSVPKPKEPQLRDFDSPQEYAKAYAQWEEGSAAPSTPAQPSTPSTPEQPASRESQPAPDEEIVDFHKRGKEKLGDEFAEALQEVDTPVNQQMGEFLIDSEYGPEIYVHLANNPDAALKIFDSGSGRISKAMADLEAKAKAGQLDVGDGEGSTDPTPADPPAGGRQKTKANEPPSSTREGGGSPTQANPETESMDDYAARRRKDELRARGVAV